MDRRILVTGSRDWTEWPPVYAVLNGELLDARKWGYRLVVTQGGARGLDDIVLDWCIERMIEGEHVWPDIHYADWERYGLSAGHRRNAEMVKLGAARCHGWPLGISSGTYGCMELADKAGIDVIDHNPRNS